MQLRNLQRQFAQEVLCGTDTGIQTLIHERGIDANQRLQIYKNNISSTLADALENTFPVSATLVGREFFRFIAQEYMSEYPPTSGSIHGYGDNFPEFITTIKELDDLAYIPDIARIDWACHDALHAPTKPSTDLGCLQEYGFGEYEHLLLHLHPSVRTVESKFPIFNIWNFAVENSDTAPIPNVGAPAQSVLVLCENLNVKVINIEQGLSVMIELVEQQITVGKIIPYIFDAFPDYNLMIGLHNLFEIGAITKVSISR